MHAKVTDRAREIARIQSLIERLHSPRLQMMLIVALTGAVGFLASFALLHEGVDSLSLRYLVAVTIAYVAFLSFLWLWLRRKRGDLLDALDIPMPDSNSSVSSSGACQVPDVPFDPGGGQFSGGASDSHGDSPEVTRFSSEDDSDSSRGSSRVSDAAEALVEVLDLDGLGVVLIAIAVLVGAAYAVVWIVWAAPTLLAELLLDVVLSVWAILAAPGRERGPWLRTAVRRTGWPLVAVALLFALGGAFMQAYAPGTKSLGEVIRYRNEVK